MRGQAFNFEQSLRLCIDNRQFDDELRALRHVVLHINFPMVFKDNGVDNSEAEAGPFFVFREIGIKDLFFVFTGYALTRVSEFDDDRPFRFLVFCMYAYSPFVPVYGFHGIRNKVDEGPFQTISVNPESGITPCSMKKVIF